MAVDIRRKAINSPDCAKENLGCPEPTNRFYVEVFKNASAEPKPVYVHIYGNCEELIIEREYSSVCDPLWAPLRCGGQKMALDEENPDIMLVVPGMYRFSTVSGEVLDETDFAVETCDVHVEYADLWIKQQQLCCCRDTK